MHIRKNKTTFRKQQKESLKSTQETMNEENVTLECSHAYGYLAVRPKNSPIPQECLFCLQLVDCLYNTKK